MKTKAGSPEPIRVCLVVASLDMLGGQSIQAARLLDGLAEERGVVAELLPINPRLPRGLRWAQRIKYVRTLVTELVYLATLLLKMPRYDVAHVFAASYLSFLIAPAPAVLIAKLFGKRVLLNYHSGEAEDHLRRWPRTAMPILRMADRVVVPSKYLVGVFARFGVEAEAIPNAVDLRRFTFRERRPLRPVLFSNRNLESHYNVAGVLRAFAIVERRVPEARLIVAGDGGEGPALRAMARELGLKQVEFVGAVRPDEMPALYNRADIFVNASLVDNMPLSILEAFACGLPVVTSCAGGIPLMVEDGRTGVLTPLNDHEAAAAAVMRLLAEQGLADRIIGAARDEGRRHTLSASMPLWRAIYQQLSRNRNGVKGYESSLGEKNRESGTSA
jgi:glycosyltransferase involved in cell wall biosynthesis